MDACAIRPPPATASTLPHPWDALGEAFSCAVRPEGLPQPRLRLVSADAARLLGLQPPRDAAEAALWAARYAGNAEPGAATPRCSVYAGHQFGNWAGRLGDGRAHLLGVQDAPDAAQNRGHARWEVQIKGAGRTPYSRFGDGRAVLRSSLREFLASEAMWHLGIATTRALCLVDSELPVRRERVERAAVLTRLAPSFLRFGHFEHFSYADDPAALRRLADWCIERLAPDCAAAPNPALELLRQVVRRTAALIAQWQGVGFIHGVMNTDNMSMLGWTLDYGPFAFMDAFEPLHTPNTTDRGGRYAWARQPAAAQWNLAALAQALLPLIGDVEAARAAVADFASEYEAAQDAVWNAKLGLPGRDPGDADLARRWLELLRRCGADWTLSWRELAGIEPEGPIPEALRARFEAADDAFTAWVADYRARLGRDGPPAPEADSADQQARAGTPAERGAARRAAMLRVNPRFVLRHHLAQQVIEAAETGDFAPAAALHEVLRAPYAEQPGADAWAAPPPPQAPPAALSCSS
jgi:uncharacterized protein YdiU (UPF0061 family)